MRKRLKHKKCCCAMCKSHKRGWSNRWKAKEAERLKRYERMKQRGWDDELA